MPELLAFVCRKSSKFDNNNNSNIILPPRSILHTFGTCRIYWQRGRLLSKHSLLLPCYGNDVIIYFIFHPYIPQTMIWRLLPQHSSASEDTTLSFYLEACPMVSKLVPLFVICCCSHCALLCRTRCACALYLYRLYSHDTQAGAMAHVNRKKKYQRQN